MLARTIQRLPDAASVLVPHPGDASLPATVIRDPEWLAEQVRLRGLIWGIEDRRTLATLWWYSASTWLTGPAIAAHVATGTILDPSLDAMVLHHRPDSRFGGSRSRAVLAGGVPELAHALRSMIAEVVTALGRYVARPAPLWAIASDAIANRYLWAGRQLGDGQESPAGRTAARVVSAAGPELPAPRFVDVPPRQFLQRSSCCLLYRVPEKQACGSCPRRDAADRLERWVREAAESAQA